MYGVKIYNRVENTDCPTKKQLNCHNREEKVVRYYATFRVGRALPRESLECVSRSIKKIPNPVVFTLMCSEYYANSFAKWVLYMHI